MAFDFGSDGLGGYQTWLGYDYTRHSWCFIGTIYLSTEYGALLQNLLSGVAIKLGNGITVSYIGICWLVRTNYQGPWLQFPYWN
jgi:hypothetical protein